MLVVTYVGDTAEPCFLMQVTVKTKQSCQDAMMRIDDESEEARTKALVTQNPIPVAITRVRLEDETK
uniref:MSP domain-containing protein n=1 Tax=Panagrellus redivivus TaxID=6233 RepID=A0A7E4VVR2_PANRE